MGLNDVYIRLCCIPGHCDIEGNEVAGKLTGLGSTNQSVSMERSVESQISNIFRIIRNGY